MFREVDQVVRGSVWARSRDAFLEAWVNGLLSSPPTHLVNMMSNTSVVFQQMYERAAAAQISRILGVDGGVQLGEPPLNCSGCSQGLRMHCAIPRSRFSPTKPAMGWARLICRVPGRLAPRHGARQRFASGPVVGRARRSRHHAGPRPRGPRMSFQNPRVSDGAECSRGASGNP